MSAKCNLYVSAFASWGYHVPVRPEFDMLPLLDEAAVQLFSRAVADGEVVRSTDASEPDSDPGKHPDRAPAGEVTGELTRDQFDRACEVLVWLGLLRPAVGRPGVLVPMSPEIAAASVVAPLEAGIARTGAQIQAIRDELGALMPHYRAAPRRFEHQEPFLLLPDAQAVAAVLAQETALCREEFIGVRPGGVEPAGTGPDPLIGDIAMLRRGVRLRALCSPVVGAGAKDRVRTLKSAGAEYRTSPELPGRAAVFDQSVALVPRPDGVAEGALLLRGREIVAYLCQVLDRLWATGAPFEDAREVSTMQLLNTGLRRALVRMLAEGVKDEIIARKLGVSLRTCRRHVAEILDGLGADSRFQGGVLAERAGLLTRIPPAPVAERSIVPSPLAQPTSLLAE